jgi:uncharacterized protein (DUF885 family)
MRPAILLTTIVLSACSKPEAPKIDIAQLSEEFVQSTLAFSPVAATSTGYHIHNGVRLDEQLDDFTPGSVEAQRKLYLQFQARLSGISRARLSPDDAADIDILDNQIALALLEYDTLQNYRHNPTLYVELIGNALYSPYVLEYAPKADRYRHIIARLEKIPALLEAAKQNLGDSPEVWTRVAQEENAGNIGLIEKTLASGVPPELKPQYGERARTAVEALRAFNKYLQEDLSKRTSDWKLGTSKYEQKFRRVLVLDKSPQKVLAEAEAELKTVRDEMHQLARKLVKPAEGASPDQTVRSALEKIAGRHSTPETYFADARRDLQEARDFVRNRGLVTVPARDNLQVIETPEFMRGIYAVGGFNPAPALEPQLGAFYWITPIPKDWKRERIESKLREYNFYGLKLLTIHEAMPGHYVQFEYANEIQPRSRRMLRGVYWNGPYVEGWAVYATEMMLDAGYLDNSPELRLTFLKQQLRMLANAILDIRLHTMGMTDEEAMRLMIEDTFQEKEEATAKLQRAKLSSCQLPTYYAGWREWTRLKARYQDAKGSDFRLAGFHERGLKAGAVPMPVLGRLMTAR